MRNFPVSDQITSGLREERRKFHPLEHQTFQFAIKKEKKKLARTKKEENWISRLSKPHTKHRRMPNNMKNFGSLVGVSELVNIIILYSDDKRRCEMCWMMLLVDGRAPWHEHKGNLWV
jgi:hypothetical protein